MKKIQYFQIFLMGLFLMFNNSLIAQEECTPGLVIDVSLNNWGLGTLDAADLFDDDNYTNVMISRGGADPYTESITFYCDEIGDIGINVQALYNGEAVSCIIMVNIQDIIPPTAVASINVVLILDSDGQATLTPEMVDDGSIDNCGIASMTLSQTFFVTDDLGNHTVFLIVVDESGNERETWTTVTVILEGDTAPTCTLGLSASLGGFNGEVVIYPQDLLANDVPGDLFISRDGGLTYHPYLTFDCDDIDGPINIIVKQEYDGEENTCSSTLNVNDAIPPLAVADSHVVIALSPDGSAILTPEIVDGGSWDNCGIATITISQTVFTTDDLGENVVLLTVTDGSGNIAQDWVTVTVVNDLGCDFAATVVWPINLTILDDNVATADVTPAYLEANHGFTYEEVNPTVPEACEWITFSSIDIVLETTGFTKILREWTGTDWLTGQEIQHAQIIKITYDPVLICINGLVVSVENGSVQLYPQDVLAPNSNLSDDLTLVITEGNGDVVPDNFITPSYVGMNLIYKVTEESSGNFCTGYLIIEEGEEGCPILGEEDVFWPLAAITVFDSGVEAADLLPENLVAAYGFEETEVNVILTNTCGLIGLNYSDEVFDMPNGGFKILREFSLVDWNYYNPPSSIGFWTFIQIITVNEDLPLLICDVLPRTAVVGDCDSGHTLEDDVEWPSNISVADHRITPDELVAYSAVDELDASPSFYNHVEDYIYTYTDLLVGLTATEITVDRVWLVTNLNYGQNWSYTQQVTIDISDFSDLVTVNTPSSRAMQDVWINEVLSTNEEGLAYVPDSGVNTIAFGGYNMIETNILDLVLATHHVLGLKYIPTANRLMADLDADGEVSEADVNAIQSLAFYGDHQWTFVDKTADLNSGITPKAHFIGYVPGDVDDSAILHGEDVDVNDDFEFVVDDVLLNAGESYELPVYLNQEVSAYGVEYQVVVNASILTIDNVTSDYFSGDVKWEYVNGVLVVLINSNDVAENIGGVDADPVFTIHASAESNSLLNLGIKFFKTFSVIATTDYEAIIFNGKIDHLIQTGVADEYLSMVKIFPNPTAQFIHIDDSRLTLKGEIQFNLYTMVGQQVLSVNDQSTIDVSDLTDGLYYYRITVDHHEMGGKITIMK